MTVRFATMAMVRQTHQPIRVILRMAVEGSNEESVRRDGLYGWKTTQFEIYTKNLLLFFGEMNKLYYLCSVKFLFKSAIL